MTTYAGAKGTARLSLDGADTSTAGSPGDHAPVQPSAQAPVGTVDQIAFQETNGYWDGLLRHFDVSGGKTITVSITALTSAEQNLARNALALWTDITGIVFQEKKGQIGVQIVFNHGESPDGPSASTSSNTQGNLIDTSYVHISSSWVNNYGTALNSYSFQSYVHEIGHALGLGHTGNYNTTADWGTQALFSNDSWSMSIMSYFDQDESSYFDGLGFTRAYAVTPMQADIVAMQTLYGLSTTTRTGDSVYGYNSNAGSVYDAVAYPKVALTIFDSGGTDTIDYSGSSANQVINLNPETFSNVNGFIGNLSIGRGVIIENAIGGSGSDTLTGNAVNNALFGGEGNDFIDGGLGNDTVAGGGGNDRIVYDAADLMSQITGGSGTDTLLFSGDTVPTSFNLGAQGFEGAEWSVVDTGSNSWSTIMKIFDASWNLTNQTTNYDDGSSVVVDIYPQQLGGLAQVWNTYDAQARLSSTDRIGADGGHTFINLDEDNSHSFTQDWFVYDSQGRLDSEDVHYDNATRTFINVDQDNSYAWSRDWFAYDGQGRLDSEDVHYDDGTRTFINIDESNNQSWDQDWFTYDAQGRLDSEDVRYGGAMHMFINFDQDNSQNWNQAWFTYDAQGRLDTQDVIYDNGTHTFYNYDQAGTEQFQLTAFLYDAAGHAYQQIIQWDDGSTTYTNL